MTARRIVVAGLLGSLVLVGCSTKKPEAPAPQPSQNAAAQRAEQERLAREKAEAAARAKREAEARARAEAAQARQVLTERIHFNFDDATILPEAQQTLQQKAQILRSHPEIQLRIAGNCDDRGSEEYNLALGMRRAQAAKTFLVNYGLDASRFQIVSYGKDRPIAQGENEQAWAQNRRDDFTITSGGNSLTPSTGQQN